MTITDGMPPQVPPSTTPQPAGPPEPERPARPSQALAWAQLVLCAVSVICGVYIGLKYSTELGSTLAGACLGGAGIRIIINVRR